VETAFAAGLHLPAGTGAVGANLTNTDTPDHTHALSGNTGNGPGTSAPLNVMQPSIVMNYMIKAE
jgi:microcystin-dependent protein